MNIIISGSAIIYIFDDPNKHGDPLKNAILFLAALTCLANIFLIGTSLAEVLIQDSGNETWVNVATYRSPGLLRVAEAVKFTPPGPSWTLDAVEIWSLVPYGENDTLPEDQTISMEIRDESLNLLYRFTDLHLPYFAYGGKPGVGVIEVPSIPISSDFYVCFYDRGAVWVGVDPNKVENNSYFYDMQTRELFLAEIAINGSEELMPVNWIIRTAGH